jgi:pimeloyl-ACP methyl ester carboxylesterase
MLVVATFVLIHGGGCGPWHWHLLEPELRGRGHDVVVVDLPCADETAGLTEYAGAVVDAVAGRSGLVLVAHSFGGYTAPLVCDRIPVDLLVMVTAEIPLPGERPDQTRASTGHAQALEEQGGGEDRDLFFADLTADLAAEANLRWRHQSGTPAAEPWPLPAWPDVPTRFLLCTQDRYFPATYMRRVVRERLGVIPEEIDSGHFPMLARPKELADRLEAYLLTMPASLPGRGRAACGSGCR